MQNLTKRLAEDRKITLTLDGRARDWLADKGWDPAYGARPLKRAIQKSVQDPLSELILSGRVKDGDKVSISAGRAGLTFNGAAVAAAA
jgi:ATP-dependent Clp protease ATP-binding subunit ClpB